MKFLLVLPKTLETQLLDLDNYNSVFPTEIHLLKARHRRRWRDNMFLYVSSPKDTSRDVAPTTTKICDVFFIGIHLKSGPYMAVNP